METLASSSNMQQQSSSRTKPSASSSTRRPSLQSFPSNISSKRSVSNSAPSQHDFSYHPPDQHHPRDSNPPSLRSRHSDASQAPLPPPPPGAAPPLPMPASLRNMSMAQPRARPIKSQYPASGGEKHVEYILVASFDIDRGSVMEHQ